MTNEKSLDEQMYNVNAWISAMYVTGLKKPTQEDMIHLNGIIAQWIKQYREEKMKKPEQIKNEIKFLKSILIGNQTDKILKKIEELENDNNNV
jgi:hypothetical protein